MNQHNSNEDTYKAVSSVLFIAVIILAGALYVVWQGKNTPKAAASVQTSATTDSQAASSDQTNTRLSETTAAPSPAPEPSTSCKDVTSYDYNWDNDVYCTRPDGSTFYTDYAGGRAADPTFER